MLQARTIKFLQDLRKNNNKEWLEANRSSYIQGKDDFENFISTLIGETWKFDAGIKGQEAKKATFRLNRDIRFSNDKTPYKTNMGASINRGGKKSIFAGYYFHLEPGGASFAGGGLWMPEAAELKKIRQEIDYSFDEFKKIINNKDFKKHYGKFDIEEGMKLVNIPKGYDKDNPAAEYLKHKSFVASKPFSDKELSSRDLKTKTIAAFKALKPLIDFLNRAME